MSFWSGVISRFSPNLAIVSDSRGVRNRAEAVIGHAREIAWIDADQGLRFLTHVDGLAEFCGEIVIRSPSHVPSVVSHER
jgi:hypothetical protein